MVHMVYVHMHSCPRIKPLSVDLLLGELSDRGWLLNNLFQLDSGLWQCNLRTATHHTAYGKGLSASLALECAIDNIESALESVSTATIEYSGTVCDLPSFNLAAALANLRQPSAPAFRRKL